MPVRSDRTFCPREAQVFSAHHPPLGSGLRPDSRPNPDFLNPLLPPRGAAFVPDMLPTHDVCVGPPATLVALSRGTRSLLIPPPRAYSSWCQPHPAVIPLAPPELPAYIMQTQDFMFVACRPALSPFTTDSKGNRTPGWPYQPATRLGHNPIRFYCQLVALRAAPVHGVGTWMVCATKATDRSCVSVLATPSLILDRRACSWRHVPPRPLVSRPPQWQA